MKAKFTDNNIDQTFKEAIDPLETQPSEKFWTEASDSILERANRSYSRKVRIWKMTSLALAAMLVCLVFYTFYTGNKINYIQKQLISLENQQVSDNTKGKINEKNQTVNVNGNSAIHGNESLNTNSASVSKPNGQLNQNSLQNSEEKSPGELNIKLSAKISAQDGIDNRSTATKESEEKTNASSASFENGNSGISPSLSVPGTIANNNSTLSESTRIAFAQNDVSVSSQLQPIASRPVSGISLLAAGNSKIEITNSSLIRTFYPVTNPVSRPSRFSIGVFAAPSTTGEFNNGKNGNLYSNSASGGEKARMAFDGGINIDYAISRKWTIESGVGYHTYSFSMQPTLIWAKPTTQGELGYAIITSCGVLHLPYHDSQLKPGDNIHANGNAYCGYLSVPLQIKYNLATGKHLGIYVTGGAIANLTIVKGAFIHWENTTDKDDESLHNIEGVSKAQYSFTLGAGLKYFLGKGFSIYGEPFMNGSATPIDKNEPIISYPYYVGMRMGLFYNL